MRKGILLLLAACASALVVGCGGGGGNSGEVTASSISKAQYVKQASAICESAAKQIKTDFAVFSREQAGEKSNQSGGEDQAAKLVNEVFAPNVEREIDELRELGAPKEDVKTVEAMLKAREEALAKVEADPKSALTNAPFEKSIKAAKDYGVVACAVP